MKELIETSSLGAVAVAAMVAATVAAIPAPVDAQEGQEEFLPWELQRFRPAPGVADYISTWGTGISPHQEWNAGATFNYSDHPMYVPGGRGVAYQAQLDLMGTVGLYDVAEVGLVVPWTLRQRDEELAEHLSRTALNDMRLTSKVQLMSLADHPVGLSVGTTISVPTGNDEALASDGGFGFETRAIGEYVIRETIRTTANLGFRYRPGETRVQQNVLGNEITWGVGVHSPFVTDDLDILGEVTGAVGVQPRPDHLSGVVEGEVPVEMRGALRYGFHSDWSLTTGLGSGLTEGIGAPNWRFFAGIDGKWATGGWWRVDYSNPDFEVQVDPCEGWDPDETVRRLRFDPEDDCPDPEPAEPRDPGAELDEPLEDTGWEPSEPETTGAEDIEDQEGRAAIRQGAIVITDDVAFETGSAEIHGDSHAVLDDVAELIGRYDEIQLLRIEGHTDNVGDAGLNMELSRDRAESVRQHLVEAGIQPHRIEAVGYGETEPVADNDTAQGRAQNRRVEFHIVEME